MVRVPAWFSRSRCRAGPAKKKGHRSSPRRAIRVGHPDFTGPGYGAIGPAGGVIEETDPSSPVAGVRVEVTPGAWRGCWEVHIGYATIFETPDYLSGYVPFERPGPSGGVDLQVGLGAWTGFERAQEALPLQLSLPMQNIHPEILDVRAAFSHDATEGRWRIVLPSGITPDRLTVATTHHGALGPRGMMRS